MTILKIKDIEIKINLFLIAILGLYMYLGYAEELIIIMATVFIHELTHVLFALRMGLKVKELEIFPFGGIARFENIIGTDPNKEIIISIIGPLVNLLIAIILKIIKVHYYDNSLIELGLEANICIGVFNLMPLFPLDGGRVLRGVLSYHIGLKSATKGLTYITYITSVLIISLGTYMFVVNKSGIQIILIAIFICIAANKEKNMAAFIFIKEISEKKMHLLKKEIMKTCHIVVLKSVSAERVLKSFLPKKYHIIIVIDNNANIVDTISETQLIEGIMKYGMNVKIEKLLNNNKKW